MTCIVAIAHEGIVYMGGERGNSDSHTIVSSTRPKIFESGPYLIGYAGNTGIGQAIVYNFDFPAVGKTNNIDRHMLQVFIPKLRSFITDNNIKLPDDSDENSSFIVGVRGRVYEIDLSDFQCVEYNQISIGSGSSYALGALHALKDYEPLEKLSSSLDAAITYSPSCQGPVDILQK